VKYCVRKSMSSNVKTISILPLMVAVAACGGGSSTSGPPAPSSNATLTGNSIVSETFNAASAILVIRNGFVENSIEGEGPSAQVFLSGETNDNISFTITIQSQGAGDDVSFDFDFPQSADSVTPNTSNFQNADGTITFSTLRPGTDIPLSATSTESISLTYSNFGVWQDTNDDATTNIVNAIGYVSYGIETDNVPTTGTANYTGFVQGTLYDGSGVTLAVSNVLGRASFTANFGTNGITGNFTEMTIQDINVNNAPVLPWVNFDLTGGTISGNEFSGTLGNFTAAGYTGSLNGGFFGPNAEEVSGTFSIQGPAQDAIGGFAATQ